MTTRRGTGEGAVYQRADGLWCASVELGRDPRTGRRRRKVVSAKTKGETLRRLADVRRTVDAGLPVTDARRSTADYLAWWLDEVLPGTVKDRTAASYRFIVDKYVTPHIGTVPVAKLAPGHVHRMLRELEKAGLSPRTQRYARAVLRRALRHAEQYGIVNRNVAALVDGPKGGGSRLDDAPTAQEARAILDAAAGDRLEAFAVLALSLGLRRGELLGLQWPDVGLETRSLTVNRTLQYMPGEGLVVSAPKTTASARTIPLPDRCTAALREHRAGQAAERLAAGPAWRDSNHVFTTNQGAPIDPRNVLRWWHTLTERAGVGRRRLHAARHTAATVMLERGAPLEVVSAVLGHASLAITADVYARPAADAKRRALESVSESFAAIAIV
jgi:integrase